MKKKCKADINEYCILRSRPCMTLQATQNLVNGLFLSYDNKPLLRWKLGYILMLIPHGLHRHTLWNRICLYSKRCSEIKKIINLKFTFSLMIHIMYRKIFYWNQKVSMQLYFSNKPVFLLKKYKGNKVGILLKKY